MQTDRRVCVCVFGCCFWLFVVGFLFFGLGFWWGVGGLGGGAGGCCWFWFLRQYWQIARHESVCMTVPLNCWRLCRQPGVFGCFYYNATDILAHVSVFTTMALNYWHVQTDRRVCFVCVCVCLLLFFTTIPRLCQFLMKIIPVINWVWACVKTSVEDDNFLTESWGCVNLMIFIWDFWHRESIIPGNLGFERKGAHV